MLPISRPSLCNFRFGRRRFVVEPCQAMEDLWMTLWGKSDFDCSRRGGDLSESSPDAVVMMDEL
jgi:hypothetical protein